MGVDAPELSVFGLPHSECTNSIPLFLVLSPVFLLYAFADDWPGRHFWCNTCLELRLIPDIVGKR